MKIKLNLKILLWSTIPLLLIYMMNFITSLAYWGGEDDVIKNFNHPVACVACFLGFVSVCIIIITNMRLVYIADDIDKLEQSKREYETAKHEMETARDRYTALLLNN